jgi:hypothetical protein
MKGQYVMIAAIVIIALIVTFIFLYYYADKLGGLGLI